MAQPKPKCPACRWPLSSKEDIAKVEEGFVCLACGTIIKVKPRGDR